MRSTIAAFAAASLLLAPVLVAQTPQKKTASAMLVARGKYLVEDTGKCGDCHTPFSEKGEPIKEQWLQGATLGFKPTVPMPVWAEKSTAIAGLPGWEKDAAIK